jgi:hypothetical protein
MYVSLAWPTEFMAAEREPQQWVKRLFNAARRVFFAPNEVKSTARSWKITMKDPYQVLKQKERDVEGVRKQIKALHLAISLLAEDADLIERGLASSPSVSRMRNPQRP